MKLVVLDAETYFDSEYTLKQLSTEAYIRDPRFEAHGAAIKWQADIPARWYDERQLRHVLAQEDWSSIFLVAHHNQFDACILSHVYSVHPARLGCTLSMARMMLGTHLSVGLDSVRRHFDMPLKTTPYKQMEGKHWHEMDAAVQQQVADGACDEVESIWRIFHLFMQQGFPPEELKIVDLTMKMFTEPTLVGDGELLARVWEKENADKTQRIEDLSITAAHLQSAQKFAELLQAEGIEPAVKPGKRGDVFAFAKTDAFMRDLLEDDDPRVRALAEARLGQKSTLLQTRAEALGWMARRGSMPVYLSYCGAHTTRWAGGDKVNWQNFPRPNDQEPHRGWLRQALMAPDGWQLGVIDLSQIECRLLNFLAGQTDVIERFKTGEDPYVGIASQFYGRRITKADPAERGTGKQLELSCGYGCGAARFKATAKLGIYGPPVNLTDEQSRAAVKLYRSSHPGVVAYWRAAETILKFIAAGKTIDWGPLTVKGRKIFLPNGARLNYDTLHWHVDKETGECYWRLETKRQGVVKLYGAKLVENVVQALARIIMSQAMIRISELGYRILTTTHDEVVVLVHSEKDAEICAAEMKRTPAWLPGIPLDAEWSVNKRYLK